jgi:urease accessory protein
MMMTMTDGSALYRLLSWLSPAFPTGGFAYSHALEWAVEAGDVRDEAGLGEWLADLLCHGSGRSDVLLARLAHRAAPNELVALAELAAALAPCAERQSETLSQGRAFALAIAAWNPVLAAILPPDPAYPVAVGAVAAASGIAEEQVAIGFLHGWTGNLVSAGVRLIPLGQSAGLRVLARLEAVVLAVVRETRDAGIESLGGACFRADIAAMRHETQYTRLFRT